MPGDIIILHICTINYIHTMHDFWDLRHDKHNFLSTWGTVFCSYTPNQPKKSNFEKLKKATRDIIILHPCPINDIHMMYGFWDMKHDKQNFLSVWTVFSPFTPLTTKKIKILKNWKKTLEISSFYTSVPKIMIICYIIPEIWQVMDEIVILHFGLFFALLPP